MINPRPIRVWTFQDLSDWEVLDRTGILVRRESDFDAESDSWLPVYAWMVEQMRKRGLSLPESHVPIWAWYAYKFTAGKNRPTFHSKGCIRSSSSVSVLMECEVPAGEALLSQFDMWEHVIHELYIPLEADDADDDVRMSWDRIEESWQRIFRLAAGDFRFWNKHRVRPIQACLCRIERDWVKQVDVFRPGRNRRKAELIESHRFD